MHTQKFKEISKTDADIAGGKGASLGEMTQAGIPVPGGFVITSETFEEFIKTTRIKSKIEKELSKVDINNINSVKKTSKKINSMIISEKLPVKLQKEILSEFDKLGSEFVAVRSSATAEDSAEASWAGQLDTFLNTNKDNLIENIKKCWASLFSPRAITYRFEKGLHKTQISVAVIVQKMVQSEISGIAFSVHPVTENRNHILIEAGYGLGEAIVSGSVTPDNYVITKSDLEIEEKNVNEQKRALFKTSNKNVAWRKIGVTLKQKQKLSDKLIKKLSKIIVQIEDHYEFPCDIEWAYEKGKLFITQSRPITTLKKIKDEDVLNNISKRENLIQKFLKDHEGEKIDSAEGIFSALGLGTSCLLTNSPIFPKYFKGYYGSLILLLKNKKAIGFASHKTYKESSTQTLNKYIKNKNNFTELKEFKEIQKKVRDLYKKNNLDKLKLLNSQQLEKTALNLFELLRDMQPITLFCEALDEDTIREYFNALKPKINFDLFIKTSSLIDFETFMFDINKSLIESNKKEIYNIQWAFSDYCVAPTLKECKTLLDINKKEKILNKLKKNQRRIKEQNVNNQKIIKKFRDSLSGKVKDLFDFIRISIWLRDTRKKDTYMLITMLSNVLREIFKREKLNENLIHYSMYSDFVTKDYKKNNFVQILKKRKQGCAIYFDKNFTKIEYVNYEKAKKEIFEVINKDKSKNKINKIKGNCAQQGFAKGNARIILNQSQFKSFKKGEVLITSMTRPEFIPLIKKASAIITNEGGITCHAAIISRELGIPCIIGTKNATISLKDGDYVEVNANEGIVTIIKHYGR